MKPPSRSSTVVVLNSATDEKFPDVSELRPRTIQLRRCDHCKTTNQRCERESANSPCRNCIEVGLADTCSPKPATTTFTYPPPQHGPAAATSPAANVTTTSSWLHRRFISKLSDLCLLIPLVSLPFLLFTPFYYHYKSNSVYSTDDPSRFIQDFDDWKRRSRSASPQNTTTISSTSNVPHPQATQNSSSLDITSQSHIAQSNSSTVTMQRQPTLPTYNTSNLHSLEGQDMPDSIKNLHSSWQDYIKARWWEWHVLFIISGFLFTTAPTIFQIQKAYDDPLSRTLAFLAIFKAIISLLYVPVVLYYFGESGNTRQAGFAVVWIKATTRGTKAKWGPWIMLSLPASATLWALIFYTLSILAFMWRASAPDDTSDDSTTTSTTLSTSAASTLRALFVIIASVDVAGVAWTWKWMESMTNEVKKESV